MVRALQELTKQTAAVIDLGDGERAIVPLFFLFSITAP